MPLDQNPYQRLVLGASAFQCMLAGFLFPKCNNFACLHSRQDENELHLKRMKSASSVSRSQAYLAKRKRIGWSIGFKSWTNWALYDVIPRCLCKIRLNHVSEILNCWERRWIDVDGASHTLSATAAIFSGVLFLDFHAFVYRWGCPFFRFFSQNNDDDSLLPKSVLNFCTHSATLPWFSK